MSFWHEVWQVGVCSQLKRELKWIWQYSDATFSPKKKESFRPFRERLYYISRDSHLHLTKLYMVRPSSNCCAKINQWSKMMFAQTQIIFVKSWIETLPFASSSTTKVVTPLKISYFSTIGSDFILGSDMIKIRGVKIWLRLGVSSEPTYLITGWTKNGSTLLDLLFGVLEIL